MQVSEIRRLFDWFLLFCRRFFILLIIIRSERCREIDYCVLGVVVYVAIKLPDFRTKLRPRFPASLAELVRRHQLGTATAAEYAGDFLSAFCIAGSNLNVAE
jgi:hypothetical protein